ncbi:cytochrome c [bacterium BMS3Abin03]|nr:cytochrome c [bacterium BMS3Abin03]
MTKPQIWVAIFLLLFIVLFILGRITKEEEVLKKIPNTDVPVDSEQGSTDYLSGEELFGVFECVGCHGTDLKGTAKGPALSNLAQFWSKQKLISYLRNPDSFMGSERFKKYREKYPAQIMPGFDNKDVKDLGKIADYLLGK